MSLLLDTNIFSFAYKQDSRFDLYAPVLQNQQLMLSLATVSELYQWAYVRRWGKKRIVDLERALSHYLLVPNDYEISRLWGEIRATCRVNGTPILPQDAWIAATALRHHVPLVTHNPRDFECVDGLTIITRVS